ncbi:hypothetical protein N0B44_22805 [Roseibacterium beibuensis]|uniref:Uncharacterized protein n=1 Tax=[Roseibacterium] beibuensis TaxID=1193142 RepID=A0ABP9LIZ7_9RHOB|nr:hypothetical protein [Roseibacterium beibuensis]MCS6625748.1 hypothetical protein [Roseibacterium beibuensis]
MRRLIPAVAFAVLPFSAAAFPANGTYYSVCAEGGGPAEGAAVATLTFPELCFDGACCELFNPTRLRLLDEEFLYDGNCEDADGTFEARIYFGEGPEPDSMVVVLRGLGETLYSCEGGGAAGPVPANDAAADGDGSPEEDAAEDVEEEVTDQ